MFVGKYGTETCGISTFEQLLNSVANADTFPDWIFNPSEHDKLESSIDNKTSGKQFITPPYQESCR